MGGTSTFDWTCLIIAFAGIVGWELTGNPLLGVWFSVLADLSAYLPAIVKTYKFPDTESPWYDALSRFAALISLMAYKIDATSIFRSTLFFVVY